MRTWSPRTRWLVVAGSTVVLLVASMLPSPLKRHPEWKWVGPDKLLHLLGHAGYVLAIEEALSAGDRSETEAAILAISLSTAHSLASGWLQRRVPGRAFEPVDVLAGLLGAVLASIGWAVMTDE
jgi:VanZ family protein